MDRYVDLINQTYEFPTVEFKELKNELFFHDIPLMKLIEKYGSPLRITYLPKITQQIQKARRLFRNAMKKYDYTGSYTYCYCTKSSHFSFVVEEALKSDIYLETSSANDTEIIKSLFERKKIKDDILILCNGYKPLKYTDGILNLRKLGLKNVIPIIDHKPEIDQYVDFEGVMQVGIRLAADEEPSFEFYTSRLGIRPSEVINFYREKIENNPKFELKLLHFFINSGMKDTSYYWNEFSEFLHLYCELKQMCPTLDAIDIGGGFPIKNSLNFDYDYKYMAEQIIVNIGNICKEYDVPHPNVYTEFGSFTVGEAGAIIYKVMDSKLQNDKELWYMIDSSFMTTIPDVWGMKQKFILLAINNWEKEYTRVNLGGITCDSMDYYNSEPDGAEIFLPMLEKEEPLYVGFFHTGAYQESVGGYGGVQHCLVPAPKQVLIDLDENDNVVTRLFAPEQHSDSMLKILGYI